MLADISSINLSPAKKEKGKISRGTSKKKHNDDASDDGFSVDTGDGGSVLGKGAFHRIAGVFKRDKSKIAERARKSKDNALVAARAATIAALSKAEGDTKDPGFVRALDKLVELYDPTTFDARIRTSKKEDLRSHLGGSWMTLSKPNFAGCCGKNPNGDSQYTLGRMSFDMFRPGKLVCSIQGTFNEVHSVSRKDRKAIETVPKNLLDDVMNSISVLRSYE